MELTTSDYVSFLEGWIREQPNMPPLGWMKPEQFPWSIQFTYRLLKKYGGELETVLLSVTGSNRGVRLISRRSIDALLLRLAKEQAANPDAAKVRSEMFRERRRKNKNDNEEIDIELFT
jgi:hypothetical protein